MGCHTSGMISTEHGGRSFGLACHHGPSGRMSIAHQHDDLEFNRSDAELVYLRDGRPFRIPPGRLAVFWAARPHQLVSDTGGKPVSWLTVPLAMALTWGLPPSFVARMLAGEHAQVPDHAALDLSRQVPQWSAELDGDAYTARTARLEIEAFARRAAAIAEAAEESPESRRAAGAVLRESAAAMAAYIADHATEDLHAADVARHVNLHPRYAMTVFRKALGIGIGEYLLQCRIGRAQHLLLTSTLPVPRVGFAAGFQSQSQFYARFRDRCGEAPAAYRRRFGQGQATPGAE